MSDEEMTPEAWRLLQVVREADSPSELDMRRVRRAIAVGVGTGAALAPAVAKAAQVATGAVGKGAVVGAVGKGAALIMTAKGVAAIAVLASVGAGTVWWSHHRSPGSVAAPLSTPAAHEAAGPGEGAAPSTLLGELNLLQRAQRALAQGAPRDALSLAEEHAKQYPYSQLARERDAVRVFADCALGRAPEARALAAQILKSAPRSPLRASLEQSCAAPLPER